MFLLSRLPSGPFIRRVACVVLGLALAAPVRAATGEDNSDPAARAAAAESEATALESREGLSEVQREAATALARAAADEWKAAAEAAADAETQSDFVARAATRIDAARNEVEVLTRQMASPTEVTRYGDSVAAATALREAEAVLSRAKSAVGEATAKQTAATSRQATLAVDLETARTAERTALEDTGPTEVGEGEQTALMRPLRAELLAARRASWRQRVLQLEQLDLALPLRSDLAAVERQAAELRTKQSERQIVGLREQVERLHRAEARAAENAAAANVTAANELPAPFPEWAARSVELARLAGNYAAERSRMREAATASLAGAADLNQSLKLAQDRVEAAAMTEATSALFLADRRELPSGAQLQADLEVRKNRLSELSTLSLDLKDESRRIAREGPPVVALVTDRQSAVAQETFSQLTERLDDASKATVELLAAVTEALEAEDNKLSAVEAYGTFLDARLLWTPDMGALRPSDVPQALRDLTHWLTRIEMRQVVGGLSGAMKRTPVPVMLLGVLGFVLLGLRRRMERRVKAWHEPVGRLTGDRFSFTVKAFAGAVLICCTLPIILLAVGLSLRSAAEFALVRATGSALTALAVVLIPLFVMRRITYKGGLGVKHFEWSEGVCLSLRRALKWLIPLLAGTSLVVAFIGAAPSADVDLRGVGRLVLMGTMLTVSVFLGRLLRRQAALAKAVMRAGGPLGRAHWLWYPLVVAAPVAVVALAGWGYYYTALRLESRLLATVLLGTALLIGYAMALRWLRLTHRRLSYEELLRKREAARVAREEAAAKAAAAARDGETPTAEAETPAVVDPDEHITPFALNEQTGQLIGSVAVAALAVGLWAVWKDVLPALGILNTIQLWGGAVSPEGLVISPAITLGALLLGIILLSLTWTAARHLPGLIDLVVLGRFGLQSGTRHAITLLLQYVIVGVGLTLALSQVGFGWSRLGWLVAALSVGLGFGLQEIFANFVSGLIILFERPIRLGDTVTVSDTTGVVTKIRIRATTITDLNQRELIVPNKEFVTSSLVNWSLSNPVTRLIVPVGIAYGADTRLAQRLLLEVAARHKSVLKDPSPSALFLGFGDNSLNFELRVFVTDVLRRFPIVSDLHLEIDEAFRRAKISIAFPQQDVHLDQIGPLEIRIAERPVPG